MNRHIPTSSVLLEGRSSGRCLWEKEFGGRGNAEGEGGGEGEGKGREAKEREVYLLIRVHRRKTAGASLAAFGGCGLDFFFGAVGEVAGVGVVGHDV